jgi:hypothetical protein
MACNCNSLPPELSLGNWEVVRGMVGMGDTTTPALTACDDPKNWESASISGVCYHVCQAEGIMFPIDPEFCQSGGGGVFGGLNTTHIMLGAAALVVLVMVMRR